MVDFRRLGVRLESEWIKPLSGPPVAISSCGGRLKAPFWGLSFCSEIVATNSKKNSALELHLKTGEVVLCDFDGLHEPEMVKRRPVVVISRSSTHWRGLCTIVPLSSTSPTRALAWHVLLSRNPLAAHLPPGHAFQTAERVWAKCDMLYTFAFDRITRPHVRVDGQRKYPPVRLPADDLAAVFAGVQAYLPSPPTTVVEHVSVSVASFVETESPPWE